MPLTGETSTFKSCYSSHVAHTCFPTEHSCRSLANLCLSGYHFGGFLVSSCSIAFIIISVTHSVICGVFCFGLWVISHRRLLMDKVNT